MKEKDNINPDHYKTGKAFCSCGQTIECIAITRHMGFSLGNAFKYIWRCDQKGGIEDLKKAIWYLENEINRREGR